VRFRFEVDGQVHAVDVERTGGPWVVTLGGRRWAAEMQPSGRGWSLLLTAADTPGSGPAVARSYDVHLTWPESDRAVVVVDGVLVMVTVAQVLAARRGGGAAARRGDGAMRAPMAGRVVRILVAPGQAVAARQGVVVVEAMKMENELRAPHPGIVRAVHVSSGASVDAGQVLVELDL
jgi:biotin carboxyl carrier protein